MTQTPENTSYVGRIGGGGAATSAGIRFQQQLGALISAWILAGERLDESLRLGAAVPSWVRFETEAPVDDLLIKTSEGGYVAVQAKTAASLSNELDSPLGKTISQFVRYWHSAHHGDGSLQWNRPLDVGRDRLVLAVSPAASSQVREDLAAALQLTVQPGGGALNQAQQRAFEVFSSLVERAWARVTKDPYDPEIASELGKLVTIFTFDGDQGHAFASGSLVKAFGLDANTANAFAILSDLSGQLMRERSGADLSTLRQLLARYGFRLSAPPGYHADIDALRQHSRRVADALGNYEKIEVATGAVLEVRRDCQSTVEAAVRSGPLLIIGEPGAGKSGVLNAVARKLRDDGLDVLQLAVDRYSIESLEGLSRELGLQHPLLDVLQAWDGPAPAYLIIDALDATRGGLGEGVFRALIEQVLERKGRWNVIASIRSFDLRMGKQYRSLFKGAPPDASLADSSFGEIQHIQVPPWTEGEFDQLLQQSPELAACLKRTPSRLRDLAMVPFNTRLLSELISGGAVQNLEKVDSQADLLRHYWDHRIVGHGLPAKRALYRVVQLMVQARALRAPMLEAGADDPAIIDSLCKEGVLVVVSNDRWVQFRHHLLFDYAAARLVLDPIAIARGTSKFSKTESLGLMLSPALGFVLREIWESEIDHSGFWTAVGTLISDNDGDPIVRSTSGRLGAEFPTSATDCLWLGDRALAKDEKALKTLVHVTGALIVRIEDETHFSLEPWAFLTERLAKDPAMVTGTISFLLHNLIGRTHDQVLTSMLGRAARALMTHGLALAEPGFVVRSSIEFVVATYSTDIDASRALLARLFERERLDRFGHEEVPAVCYKVSAIGDVDPEFVSDCIYRTVFEYEVTDERQTQIGQSRILTLTSDARQDYGMARWSLGEYLPKFLKFHPRAAIKAIVDAVESCVLREHPVSPVALDTQLLVAGRSVRLREDHSYVWAHDPDHQYDRNAEGLVSKLRKSLTDASEIDALVMLDILIEQASFAIFWSRMFLCAVEREDGAVDKLWSIAATEPFLVLPDTRKDAIDLVALGIVRKSVMERQIFEHSVFRFDFSRFEHRTDAQQLFLLRLFTAIGRDNLTTEKARKLLDSKDEKKPPTNERLFRIESGWGAVKDFHWIDDLDRELPENLAIISAIKFAKQLLGLESSSDTVVAASLADSIASLQAVRESLLEKTSNAELQRYAEGIIAQGCYAIVSRKLLVSIEAPPTSEQDATFLALLTFISASANPGLGVETESQFEESASWGSPAARVEAAQAYWDLMVQRADLYSDLMPRAEALLSDLHPAVRLNASIRLVRIWDIDRDLFWNLLSDRLTRESNLTIVEHLVNDVVSKLIHIDQQRSLGLLLVLAQREAQGSHRERRMFKVIASSLTVLWITFGSAMAKVVLDRWLAVPWKQPEEVRSVLVTSGNGIVAGIGEVADKSFSLRQRSRDLVSDIVKATNVKLAIHMARSELDEGDTEEAKQCVNLIDTAAMQMFFATTDAGQREDRVVLDEVGIGVFLAENTELLKQIGEFAQPHTTYYLLQLVERLVSADAGAAFDLAARTLHSSRRSGYQYESLGSELLVRLVGVFLADHKEIFEDPIRRAALVDCLEMFLEAGWPAARRLLYRLPELIQ